MPVSEPILFARDDWVLHCEGTCYRAFKSAQIILITRDLTFTPSQAVSVIAAKKLCPNVLLHWDGKCE